MVDRPVAPGYTIIRGLREIQARKRSESSSFEKGDEYYQCRYDGQQGDQPLDDPSVGESCRSTEFLTRVFVAAVYARASQCLA